MQEWTGRKDKEKKRQRPECNRLDMVRGNRAGRRL